MTLSRFVVLFVAAPMFVAPFARAQKAPSQAAAQALFEEGRRLMNAGKYSDACPKLAESQRLDPGAGTLLNLAACYEKNGQTASAWATYKEAISESEKSNRKEWAARARQRAGALESSLSKMIIAVPAPARAVGLTVKRDGADVGPSEWGVPIPVDPGNHSIEATAPGRKPWTTTQQIGRTAETATVTVPMLEAAPQAQTPPASEPHKQPDPAPVVVTPPSDEPARGSTQRTIGFVVGGVGVAGLAVGAIFGLQAMGAKSDAKNGGNCSPDFSSCNQSGIDAVDDAKGLATISTIGFAAGAALTIGGVALILTAPKSSSKMGAAPALRVGGVGSGLGLSVGGNL